MLMCVILITIKQKYTKYETYETEQNNINWTANDHSLKVKDIN